MTEHAKQISLEGLSVADRMSLIEQIWDSIAAEQESLPLTQAQKDELDRRLAAYEADPTAGSTWEEVKARLQGKQ